MALVFGSSDDDSEPPRAKKKDDKTCGQVKNDEDRDFLSWCSTDVMVLENASDGVLEKRHCSKKALKPDQAANP